jgi:hypothetical protein
MRKQLPILHWKRKYIGNTNNPQNHTHVCIDTTVLKKVLYSKPHLS